MSPAIFTKGSSDLQPVSNKDPLSKAMVIIFISVPVYLIALFCRKARDFACQAGKQM
jgi:hypothetical protein